MKQGSTVQSCGHYVTTSAGAGARPRDPVYLRSQEQAVTAVPMPTVPKATELVGLRADSAPPPDQRP